MTTIHLAQLGTFLGARTSGEEVRHKIENALKQQEGGTVTLDASGVDGITQGWADEALAKLNASDLHRVKVQGANSTIKAILRHALSVRHCSEWEVNPNLPRSVRDRYLSELLDLERAGKICLWTEHWTGNDGQFRYKYVITPMLT